jgi:hypothetical protein
MRDETPPHYHKNQNHQTQSPPKVAWPKRSKSKRRPKAGIHIPPLRRHPAGAMEIFTKDPKGNQSKAGLPEPTSTASTAAGRPKAGKPRAHAGISIAKRQGNTPRRCPSHRVPVGTPPNPNDVKSQNLTTQSRNTKDPTSNTPHISTRIPHHAAQIRPNPRPECPVNSVTPSPEYVRTYPRHNTQQN